MTPEEEGIQAVLSSNPEPECPYTPGTDDYSAYAKGFCHRIEETIQDIFGGDYGM